jgi:hypothetical protein
MFSNKTLYIPDYVVYEDIPIIINYFDYYNIAKVKNVEVFKHHEPEYYVEDKYNYGYALITIDYYYNNQGARNFYSAIENKKFTIKFDSSGTGPSDHTSFYRKDIPVLFFFTGLHTDYHKPSDDADKINYTGQLQIVKFINQLVLFNKSNEKYLFTKTREQQTSTSAKFSVSMGIMPDYTFSGNGVRVDGVSDNRPAKLAGLLAGDIVKQLGEYKTSSVEAYMQALSKFKKGDKVIVIILRSLKELEFQVNF